MLCSWNFFRVRERATTSPKNLSMFKILVRSLCGPNVVLVCSAQFVVLSWRSGEFLMKASSTTAPILLRIKRVHEERTKSVTRIYKSSWGHYHDHVQSLLRQWKPEAIYALILTFWLVSTLKGAKTALCLNNVVASHWQM